MANIRGNYFRPAAVCGIRAVSGRPRPPGGGGETHPEGEIEDVSPRVEPRAAGTASRYSGSRMRGAGNTARRHAPGRLPAGVR